MLFLSRVDPKKGLELLLPALASVPHATLVIAGSGDEGYVASLKRLARELHIEERIVWAGYLEGNDKLAALAAADLFVLPSYSENFGIAVVEALAAGLPVLITDQVAIHREVAQAGAGRVVPCDSDALAGALAALLDDAGARQAMGARGRALAAERFSLEEMTSGLVGLYEAVVGANRSSSRGNMEID